MSYRSICLTFSFASLLLVTTFGRAQTGLISTIVGTGTPGYSGDGGPATSAIINNPIQVITDASGNVYFADNNSNVIRKISTSGIITTVVGTGVAGYSGDGGPATAAELSDPWGLAIDAAGNLYIGDTRNAVVRKVNTAGIISTIAGTGMAGYGGDGGPATAARLQIPALMRLDNTGNLFFCDNANHRVRKITPLGTITIIAGNGIPGSSGDGGTAVSAAISFPAGVAPDASGNIYISDAVHNVIRKVNSAGIISTFAGTGTAGYTGDGGPASTARLNYPQDIFIDASGNIYFSDTYNNVVRKINIAGIISTVAGSGTAGFSGDGGPATAAQLHYPVGVYQDNSGKTYISDPSNNRIRRVVDFQTLHFTHGHRQNLTICNNEMPTAIDTQLAVMNTTAGQTETWSLIIPPAHGTAVVTYTTTSTGSIFTPIGLTYTPSSGFTGIDSFKVRVSNGTITDETVIVVLVDCHTGVNSLSDPGAGAVKVFPNPAADGEFEITVFANAAEDVQLTVTNVVGQKVRELTGHTNNPIGLKVDAPSGIYFLTASTKDSKLSQKIIISTR